MQPEVAGRSGAISLGYSILFLSAFGAATLLPLSSEIAFIGMLEQGFGEGVLAGAGLESGEGQGGGDVASFERPGDPEEVVPVPFDDVDLSVVSK